MVAARISRDGGFAMRSVLGILLLTLLVSGAQIGSLLAREGKQL